MKFSVILGCLLGILALSVVSMDYDGTALAQESIKAVCPTCGEKDVLRKGMGITPLEKTMYCPDCKGKGAQHVCEKCGAEVVACSMCEKVIAVVERETIDTACPFCAEKVTLRKGMGMTAIEEVMVCPYCKGEGAEHVCEKCGAEIGTCPTCLELLAAGAEEVKAVCPQCKVVRTLKKGTGIVALQKTMKCPACEKPIKGFKSHACSECGTHMALCPICKETI